MNEEHSGAFENQPATKQDIADVREDLTEVRQELKEDIAEVRQELKEDIRKLEESVRNGFEHMEKLLGGPRGLIPRVKRLEEKVGIRPNA